MVAELILIDESIEIDASADLAFRTFTLVDKWPEWCTAISNSRIVDKDLREGSVIEFSPDFIFIPLKATILEYDKPNRIVWGANFPGGSIEHRFEFIETGEDTCKLQQTEIADGWMKWIMWPLKNRINNFDGQLAVDLKYHIEKVLT